MIQAVISPDDELSAEAVYLRLNHSYTYWKLIVSSYWCCHAKRCNEVSIATGLDALQTITPIDLFTLTICHSQYCVSKKLISRQLGLQSCLSSLCYLIRPLWLYTACTAAKRTDVCLFFPFPQTNNCATTQVTMYNGQMEQRRVTLMFIACRPVPPSPERHCYAMQSEAKQNKKQKTQAHKCLATIMKMRTVRYLHGDKAGDQLGIH